MTLYLLIALGGALGSVSRFAMSGLVANQIGETFPWGTLVVNVLGSFLISFFATLTGPDGRILVGSGGRMFFMTGVMGGFTTFSSFSLQTLALMRDGDWFRAGGNVLGSVIVCIVAAWLGHLLAFSLNSSR